MRERRDHRVIGRQRRRTELLQQPAGELHGVAVAVSLVASMQQQIDEAKAHLSHLRVGRTEGAGALHLLEQFLGNRGAALPVAREQVQSVALPAPVLHDLGR
jgi:hypothetical protein